MRLCSCFVTVVAWLAAWPVHAVAGDIDKHSFEFAGARRVFYLYAPAQTGPQPPALVVLLHGSYGKAQDMVALWADLARDQGFVVAAPIARRSAAWQIRADGSSFIRAFVDEVARLRSIDRARIYLFGHSGGAVYALTLSMLESDYFAATAVHAGAWRSTNEFIAVPHAKRAIPVAMFVGDRDEYFRLQDVRKTYEALQTAGHPSNLTVIHGHTHTYARVAAEVNEAAWNWMKVYASRAAEPSSR